MADSRCAICNGTREEHKDRMHQYTETPGALNPVEKKKPAAQAQTVVMRGSGPPEVARLVQLMLEKGLITPEEALYVFIGERQSPQFADPAQLMKTNSQT